MRNWIVAFLVWLVLGGVAAGIASDGPAQPETPAVVMEPAEQPSKPADEPMGPEERRAACSAAVTSALKKYDCTLQVAMLVTQKGNEPIVQVVPNQQEIKK